MTEPVIEEEAIEVSEEWILGNGVWCDACNRYEGGEIEYYPTDECCTSCGCHKSFHVDAKVVKV